MPGKRATSVIKAIANEYGAMANWSRDNRMVFLASPFHAMYTTASLSCRAWVGEWVSE